MTFLNKRNFISDRVVLFIVLALSPCIGILAGLGLCLILGLHSVFLEVFASAAFTVVIILLFTCTGGS